MERDPQVGAAATVQYLPGCRYPLAHRWHGRTGVPWPEKSADGGSVIDPHRERANGYVVRLHGLRVVSDRIVCRRGYPYARDLDEASLGGLHSGTRCRSRRGILGGPRSGGDSATAEPRALDICAPATTGHNEAEDEKSQQPGLG